MKNLIFDLDGTLINSYNGISTSIRHAMKKMQAQIDPSDDLTWCIGPPLRQSFAKLLATDDKNKIERVMQFYIQYYLEKGIFAAHVYNGITELLSCFKQRELRLFIATAKYQTNAVKILKYFKLDDFFTAIYGVDPERKYLQKSKLLNKILSDHKLNKNHCIMIGDRKNDIQAAIDNNIKSIGVTYGFGSEEELLTAGASKLCQHPNNLLQIIQEYP